MARQAAISVSISFHFPFIRAGGRTFDVGLKTQMKRNQKIFAMLAALALTLIVGLSIFTPLVENCWLVSTGRGFFIPDESSILKFHVTEMNDGSGEWWLHAEDDHFFYAYSESAEFKYRAFPKSKVSRVPNFEPMESATWPEQFTICPSSNTQAQQGAAGDGDKPPN